MKKLHWRDAWIQRLVVQSLREDRASHDRTTRLLIPSKFRAEAVIRSKQRGVVCGLPFAKLVFEKMNRKIKVILSKQEGVSVRPGDILMRIQGPAGSILSAERAALNAIQHLSGIATWTRVHVTRLGQSRVKLLDTRKTIPGWRMLAKYAVYCGGGVNHRADLSEAILIKENHLELAKKAGVRWRNQIAAYQKKHPRKILEMEVQNLDDLENVLVIRPRRVLLDNLPSAQLKTFIQRLRRVDPSIEIEVSGGIRASDLPRLGQLAIDRISMGALTHSAPAFDCSLDWIER